MLRSPASVFYEDYQQADNQEKQEMYRRWLVRYKRRGDRDADQLKLRRRFMQYLNLGKKLPARVARLGGRQVLSIRNGAIAYSNLAR